VEHEGTRRHAGADIVVENATAILGDGLAIEVRLRIPAASRDREDPLDLLIQSSGFSLSGERVLWLVATNEGWLHLRGIGRFNGGSAAPFRCDLLSSETGGTEGPDLIAVRVYDADADPNRDGPVARLRVSLPPGSVQLGGEPRPTAHAKLTSRG